MEDQIEKLKRDMEEVVEKHLWSGEDQLHLLRADMKALAQKYIDAQVIKPEVDARVTIADAEFVAQIKVAFIDGDTCILTVTVKNGAVSTRGELYSTEVVDEEGSPE